METSENVLESIRYRDGRLDVIDQLGLPETLSYLRIRTVEEAYGAIREMRVRGAPAIALVACLSLAVELRFSDADNRYHMDELVQLIRSRLQYLISARPTAVNVSKAADQIIGMVEGMQGQEGVRPRDVIHKVVEAAEDMLEKDRADNLAVSRFGADSILAGGPDEEMVSVLTHCNTGALATAGYGTALGIVRELHRRGRLEMCYYTETRPYNQGARLTGFEMVHEKIPATLICDSAAGWLMNARPLHAVITGADRGTLTGEVGNKIGTYGLAVLARHHQIPFYIAMPTTSFDPRMVEIPIEERAAEEMTDVGGRRVAAPGVRVWNPAFDRTPPQLITGGIVTEFGIFPADKLPQAYQNGWKNQS